jgi:hypothetical protein
MKLPLAVHAAPVALERDIGHGKPVQNTAAEYDRLPPWYV